MQVFTHPSFILAIVVSIYISTLHAKYVGYKTNKRKETEQGNKDFFLALMKSSQAARQSNPNNLNPPLSDQARQGARRINPTRPHLLLLYQARQETKLAGGKSNYCCLLTILTNFNPRCAQPAQPEQKARRTRTAADQAWHTEGTQEHGCRDLM